MPAYCSALLQGNIIVTYYEAVKTSFETFRCVSNSDGCKVAHPSERLLRKESEVFLRSYGDMLISTCK